MLLLPIAAGIRAVRQRRCRVPGLARGQAVAGRGAPGPGPRGGGAGSEVRRGVGAGGGGGGLDREVDSPAGRVALEVPGGGGEKGGVEVEGGGEGGEVEQWDEECAGEEGEEGEGEDDAVADEDAELVGEEAEMVLHRGRGCWLGLAGLYGVEGFAVWVYRIPHTDHDETRSSYTHGPADALDCDLSSVVLVRGVHYLTVIVVVPGEHRHHVANGGDQLHGVHLAQDILILVTGRDGDGVPLVRNNWRRLSLGWWCWAPAFPIWATRSACTTVEWNVSEEDSWEICSLRSRVP